MVKITSTIRRMKTDREYCEAIFAFVDANDRLRQIELNDRDNRRLCGDDRPRLVKNRVSP